MGVEEIENFGQSITSGFCRMVHKASISALASHISILC